nr:aminotransferase class V-fold PLP-dependent enzyme [Sulfobacillus harzensis]
MIPAATNRTYLNAGTLGPTPGTALAAAAAGELEWIEAGPGQHNHYVNAKDGVRRFAGRVESRMPGGVVSITENNSESLLRVFWGLRFEAGDEIITTDQEHGAVLLALSSVMRRFDLTVHVVHVDSPGGLLAQVKEKLNGRTRLVVMSHVSCITGWQLPIRGVSELVSGWPDCRLLVDGAQALGNVVVDPEALGADFYVFCGHKWMMAPPGWAGLWVKRERRSDLYTRWPLEDFQSGADLLEEGPFLQYSESGDDLEYGTRAWPRIAGWSITWDYFEEEGFHYHAQYQRGLADQAKERIQAIKGFSVDDPPSSEYQRTALMTVASEQLGSGLYEWLLERDIVAKAAPARYGIRISWAAFNTSDDVERLVAALATV